MEIERKYLISKSQLPVDLKTYPCRRIEQGYLCTEPVVRIRQDNEDYILTYKSKGFLSREEYNLPLTKAAYAHLKSKVDGRLITKDRYCIPYLEYIIELDVFHGDLTGLLLAEVEFPDEESAIAFQAPEWFGKDVTFSPIYQNSSMSSIDLNDIIQNVI